MNDSPPADTDQTPVEANPQLMHDIQMIVSRLVCKSERLIANCTTNLAENWMQIRWKFDGGKVVNRSHSESWENRCYGAGLQKNVGKTWGPTMWEKMTGSSANDIFNTAAETFAKRAEQDKKRSQHKKKKIAGERENFRAQSVLQT